MKASFVDLRTRSGEVIRALHRNEAVTVYYRGKPAAVMHPVHDASCEAPDPAAHEAFGIWKDRDDLADPAACVRRMRKGRFGDL